VVKLGRYTCQVSSKPLPILECASTLSEPYNKLQCSTGNLAVASCLLIRFGAVLVGVRLLAAIRGSTKTSQSYYETKHAKKHQAEPDRVNLEPGHSYPFRATPLLKALRYGIDPVLLYTVSQTS
jgi:hypothetical protein